MKQALGKTPMDLEEISKEDEARIKEQVDRWGAMWEKIKEKKSKDKPTVHSMIEEMQDTSFNPINIEEEEFIQGTLTSKAGNPSILEMEIGRNEEKKHVDKRVIEDTLDSQISFENVQNVNEPLQVFYETDKGHAGIEIETKIFDEEATQFIEDGIENEENPGIAINEEDKIQREESENLDRQENISLQIEEAVPNPTNPEYMLEVDKKIPISKNMASHRDEIPEPNNK